MQTRSDLGRSLSRCRSVVAAALLACLGVAIPGLVLAQTFNDVPTEHWAYPYIEILAASGITSGCGGSNYCPLAPVTRAQMAVFLERGMHGSDFVPPAADGNIFLDVGAGDFAASFIEQLFFDRITGGCGNDRYCPAALVTRAEMAVFLLRAKHGSDYSPPAGTGLFNDVPLSYWAAHWIEQLAREAIATGCGDGNYCPEAPVNRDQMAVLLVRTVATPLSGVLQATTYSAGLYILLGRTDVAPNTTVVFSAGSQLYGQGNELRVFGTLRMAGTASRHVRIDNVRMTPYSQTYSDRFRIELGWCDMQDGSFFYPTGNAGYESFSVTDCHLSNLPYAYIWYPAAESEFLRNVVVDSEPIGILLDGRTNVSETLTIQNNSFARYKVSGFAPASAIDIIEVYNPDNLRILGNSFLDVGAVSIALEIGGYTRRLIDATNNYWGTTNPSVIASMVFDENDDFAAPGVLSVTPYLTAPDPNTPN